MSDLPIFISSVDGIGGSKPQDFTITFPSPIMLETNKQHYIALDTLKMTYSWHNISAKNYNNNILRYSPDNGANWHEISFYDGNDSYEDINSFVQLSLKDNTHSETGVKIQFIYTILLVLIELEPNYRVDLRQGNFSDLIGWDKKIVTQSSYGTRTPNITNSVDDIYIHCNLISDSHVSSNRTDVLYQIGTDNLTLSYPFKLEPKQLLFNKINTDQIGQIRIHISDTLRRPIDLNDVPISLILLVKTV